MENTVSVSQQISATAALLACYKLCEEGRISAFTFFIADMVLLAVGTVLHLLLATGDRTQVWVIGKQLCLFLALLRVVAPVLRTLTLSVADDSIQALLWL